MIRFPKDIADNMVMNVLTSISKSKDASSEFAKESLEIMDNHNDSVVLTGVLIGKIVPSVFSDNEIRMKTTVIASLQAIVDIDDDSLISDFSKDLKKLFYANNVVKTSESTKLDFALNQFVNAFYEYERLDKKYPELMKFM